MVGFGDKMGAESTANLAMAARADGVLVKPDVPIVPVDSAYLAEARETPETPVALVASTYTDGDDTRVKTVKFQPGELGMGGPVYVYDYFSGRATHVAARSAFAGDLNADRIGFYVVASPGKSGVAFLGDAGKFVSTGKQRISSMKDSTAGLSVTVILGAGESLVRLHGCAEFAPSVSVKGGTAGKATYNAITKQFAVDVRAAAGQRVMTVTFSRPSI